MEGLVHDLRYTVRSWRRHPLAIAAAAGALALAIAAVTAIYSLVAGVLVRPLPYPEPERLVMIWQDLRARGGPERDWISPGLVVEWQRRAPVTGMLAPIGAVRGWQPTLSEGDEPERLRGAAVSEGYFTALGVPARLGRTFTADDDRTGGPPLAILSHGLWTRRFGGEPRVVGRTVRLDGQPTEIVGVMPASFRGAIVDAEIWSPLRINPAAAPRGMVTLRVLARLTTDASLQQASARIAAVAADLAQEDPEWERARTVLVPLHTDIVGNVRPMLLVLSAAVGCVLLLATANLAHILLARAAARVRETTVRTALGAGRWQIVRPVVSESLLLAAAATASGAMAGWWALRGLLALAPASAPRLQDVRVDAGVLLTTAAATFAATLLAALAPAAVALRANLTPGLGDGGRASTGSSRLRSTLVAAEVALALVLLVGAALLTRTLIAMQRVDLGFRAEGLLTATVQPPRGAYRDPEAVRRLFSSLLDGAGAIRGVQSVALTSLLPLGGGEIRINFGIPGRPPAAGPEDEPIAAMRQVSAGYFKTMGGQVVSGREVTVEDTAAAPRIAIVNEALAARYWPGANPVGRKVEVEQEEATIVGVVANVHHTGPTVPASPEMYLPYTQFPARAATLVLRTNGTVAALATPLRQVVRGIDPRLPLAAVAPMTELVSRSVAQARFVAALLAGFALLATAVTIVGVYGVQAFSVSRRTREIGVRMALGAGRRRVVGMVLRESLARVFAGLGIGLLAALALAQLIRAQLFGITPTDSATYLAMTGLIGGSALVASYIPARRAARVDPLVALRED
jgi:putative ABC transport system permease protein